MRATIIFFQSDTYRDSEAMLMKFQLGYLIFGNLIPIFLVITMNCMFSRIQKRDQDLYFEKKSMREYR